MSFGMNTFVGGMTGALVAGPVGLLAGAGLGAMMDNNDANRYQQQQSIVMHSRHLQEMEREKREHELRMAREARANELRKEQLAYEAAKQAKCEAEKEEFKRIEHEIARKKEEMYEAEITAAKNWINTNYGDLHNRINLLGIKKKQSEFKYIVAEIEKGTRTSQGYFVNTKINHLILNLTDLFELHTGARAKREELLHALRHDDNIIRKLMIEDYDDTLSSSRQKLMELIDPKFQICGRTISITSEGGTTSEENTVKELRKYLKILNIREFLISGRPQFVKNLDQVFEFFSDADEFLLCEMYNQINRFIDNIKTVHPSKLKDLTSQTYAYIKRIALFSDVSNLVNKFKNVLYTTVLEDILIDIAFKEKKEQFILQTNIKIYRAIFETPVVAVGDTIVIDTILKYYEKKHSGKPPVYSSVNFDAEIPEFAKEFINTIASFVTTISELKGDVQTVLLNPFSIDMTQISNAFDGRVFKVSARSFLKQITEEVNTILAKFHQEDQLKKVVKIKALIGANFKLSKWDKKIRIVNMEQLKISILECASTRETINISERIDAIHRSYLLGTK